VKNVILEEPYEKLDESRARYIQITKRKKIWLNKSGRLREKKVDPYSEPFQIT
jgi:hypothetical protein